MDNQNAYLQGLADRLRIRKDPDQDIEWQDIADYMTEQTGVPVAKEYCRKGAPLFYLFDEAGWVREPESGDGAEGTYLRQKLEADKAAIKARDERNELARIQRELARRESVVDTVRDILHSEVTPLPGYVPGNVEVSDTDLIVHLTDIHAGIEVDNYCNEYNSDVLHQRLDTYLDKIREVANRHCAENCHVLLGGDLISGAIHSTIRIENQMDVIRQLKLVSMEIGRFVSALSVMFGNVDVYSVSGNHSRLSPNKQDHLKGENLDALVPFYLTALLQNYENVHIHEENVEESVAMFSVRGQRVFGAHGDKDTPENVVQRLTMMFGVKPDIVMLGHRHTNGMKTVYDTKVVESGCVSGPDNYCMDHRLRNKPEQAVLVVSDDGLECLYDVKLD